MAIQKCAAGLRMILGFVAAAMLVGCTESSMDTVAENPSPPVEDVAQLAAVVTPEPKDENPLHVEVMSRYRQARAITGPEEQSAEPAAVEPGPAGVVRTFSPNAGQYPGASAVVAAVVDEAPTTGEDDGGVELAVRLEDRSDSNPLADSQDFEWVSTRESIETAAARREQSRQSLIVYQPTDLPPQPGSSSVARYALSVSHGVGSKVYERPWFKPTRRMVRKRCGQYPDPYSAQVAFLDAGGPATDAIGLDPDGDGFVCGWTPNIYRRML